MRADTRCVPPTQRGGREQARKVRKYLMHMDVNERLASRVIAITPEDSQWVFNRYCQNCGRFLYTDDWCRKCGTEADDPIKHPIPFANSATAMEKLMLWLKRHQASIGGYNLMVAKLSDITLEWMADDTNDIIVFHSNLIETVLEYVTDETFSRCSETN